MPTRSFWKANIVIELVGDSELPFELGKSKYSHALQFKREVSESLVLVGQIVNTDYLVESIPHTVHIVPPIKCLS